MEFLRDSTRKEEPQAFPVLDSDEAHVMLAILCLQYTDSCSAPAPAAKSKAKDKPMDKDNTSDAKHPNPFESDDELDSHSSDCWDDEVFDMRAAVEYQKHEKEAQGLKLIYPLLDYATNNVAYHASRAGERTAQVWEAMDMYLVQSKLTFQLVLLVKWLDWFRPGMTALHLAVVEGTTAYVEHLLIAGVPVDARGDSWGGALSYAAKAGLVDIAGLLLEYGADPQAGDDVTGKRALHFCAANNHLGIAKLLLAKGVSLSLRRVGRIRS